MSTPTVPLANNIVEDTSGTSPISGSSVGGAIGDTGGNLAGLAGGANGNKVGGARREAAYETGGDLSVVAMQRA